MNFISPNVKDTPLLKKLLTVTALLIPVLLKPAIADSGLAWSFVSNDHTSYQVLGSIDAQEGMHLISIDGTTLEFPIDYERKDRYWLVPHRPGGYLYQSIKAQPYVSKHLHISGFARGIRPNFSELEKQFSEYHQGAQEVRLSKFLSDFKPADQVSAAQSFKQDEEPVFVEKMQEFQQYIRSSYKNSQYGISVLLDMGADHRGRRMIKTHEPTSVGAPRLNELWNRFNVEVGVPSGCRSITIVLWQRGIAISEFDHLVVSEQGDVIDTNSSDFYRGPGALLEDIILEKIIEENDLESRFLNLSFE